MVSQPEGQGNTTSPVVLMVAPNGARTMKSDHAAVPITPDEIGHCAAQCLDAGASAIHIHGRDADGIHALDAEIYGAAIAAIRGAVGNRLLLQITTELVGQFTPAHAIEVVRAVKPESVSIAVREIVPNAQHEPIAAGFFRWIRENEVIPQFIVYSVDDLRRYLDLKRRGIIPFDRAAILFVLGRYGSDLVGRPIDLAPLLAVLCESGAADPWSVCCFGLSEADAALAAISFDGHARLGFENNQRLRDGTLAPDNAGLIDQTAQVIRRIGRMPATADEARSLLRPA